MSSLIVIFGITCRLFLFPANGIFIFPGCDFVVPPGTTRIVVCMHYDATPDTAGHFRLITGRAPGHTFSRTQSNPLLHDLMPEN
ncbi:MAG: hypothetical protein ABL994_05480, partial [Verrucomicrobiales bacterium]